MELRTAELQEANEQLESFVYTVSHDLRGPIRTSEAYSNIVLEEFEGALPEEAVEYIKLTRRSSTHLGELVEDLLQFSRLGRQKPVMQTVDVASMVKGIVARYDFDESISAEFVTGDLPPAVGDSTLLHSLFSNLIGNAAKFSAPVENPRVEICSESKSGDVVYSVRDNGVGFNPEHAERIFGVFERLHSSTEFEGTGVGLAIVSKVVERHGGTVWFESEVGKGTTFSFTLDGRSS